MHIDKHTQPAKATSYLLIIGSCVIIVVLPSISNVFQTFFCEMQIQQNVYSSFINRTEKQMCFLHVNESLRQLLGASLLKLF